MFLKLIQFYLIIQWIMKKSLSSHTNNQNVVGLWTSWSSCSDREVNQTRSRDCDGWCSNVVTEETKDCPDTLSNFEIYEQSHCTHAKRTLVHNERIHQNTSFLRTCAKICLNNPQCSAVDMVYNPDFSVFGTAYECTQFRVCYHHGYNKRGVFLKFASWSQWTSCSHRQTYQTRTRNCRGSCGSLETFQNRTCSNVASLKYFIVDEDVSCIQSVTYTHYGNETIYRSIPFLKDCAKTCYENPYCSSVTHEKNPYSTGEDDAYQCRQHGFCEAPKPKTNSTFMRVDYWTSWSSCSDRQNEQRRTRNCRKACGRVVKLRTRACPNTLSNFNVTDNQHCSTWRRTRVPNETVRRGEPFLRDCAQFCLDNDQCTSASMRFNENFANTDQAYECHQHKLCLHQSHSTKATYIVKI